MGRLRIGFPVVFDLYPQINKKLRFWLALAGSRSLQIVFCLTESSQVVGFFCRNWNSRLRLPFRSDASQLATPSGCWKASELLEINSKEIMT